VFGYRQMMDEALKKVRVNVKTAFALSDEMRSLISASLEKSLGKKVDMTVEEDTTLLGGVVIGVWRYTLRWQYKKSVE